MDAIRYKVEVGAVSNDKGEHRYQTHSGFKEKAASDHGKKRECPDIDVEVEDKLIKSVIGGGLEFGTAQAPIKQKCGKTPMREENLRQDAGGVELKANSTVRRRVI